MNNLANNYIQAMTPYKPPLEGRAQYPGILLDFNERTILTSDSIKEVLKKFINEDGYRRYPEYSGDLEKKLVAYLNEPTLTPDNIMMTNGGDQAIDVAVRTFTQLGDMVVIPSPSFAMFYQAAGMNGNKIVEVPYNEDLTFPAQQVLAAITPEVKLVIICTPNNPTGTLVPPEDISAIAKAAPHAVVLLDEAYAEFSGVSSAGLIAQSPNIMILRSFSKPFGLAGLRIGYLIADASAITEMLKVRGPYDVNTMAYLAAIAALNDWPETKQYIDEVMTQAKPLVEQFFADNGITYYPSRSNYILFKPKDSKTVVTVMDKAGFRTRPRSGVHIDGTIRVTIGTVKQMEAFIKAYQTIL